MLRPFALTTSLFLLVASSSMAQDRSHSVGLSPRLAAATRANQIDPSSQSTPGTGRPTYWKEGAAVGGLVGATVGALGGAAICGQSDEQEKDCTGSTILGGLVGAVLLAFPGALVGGLFPKAPR